MKKDFHAAPDKHDYKPDNSSRWGKQEKYEIEKGCSIDDN
jgi:hypothetical protein